MKNKDYLNQLFGARNHQQEKETTYETFVYPYADMLEQFRSAHSRNRKDAPGYITAEIHRIQPVDFVQSLKFLSPEMSALFLKVLADHELWTTFRQKAAEAVCKEDKEYFLTVQSFPFCFAYAARSDLRFYRFRPKWFPLMLVNYTFDDLALIAEKILDGNNMNQQLEKKEE